MEISVKIKKELREKNFALRKGLSTGEIERKSKEIKNSLFSLKFFKEAQNIMFYLAINNEVHTEEMVKKSLERGKKIYAPVTDFKEKNMEVSRVKNYEKDLAYTKKGLLEPKVSAGNNLEAIVKELELIIIPGVAFDSFGNRIGYGGGYYDKFLADVNALKVALAFEKQLVDKIPEEEHDIKMDKVITEQKIIDCKNIK